VDTAEFLELIDENEAEYGFEKLSASVRCELLIKDFGMGCDKLSPTCVLKEAAKLKKLS